MRKTNTLIIMDCIREYGPITKKDIQSKTGLSWGAVSNITAELLVKKIIYEAKSTDSLIGRTPFNIDINTGNNLIIGIDINAAGLSAVLMDLKCKVQKSMNTDIVSQEKEGIIEEIKNLIYLLIKDKRINKKNIIGIGAAMQGAVDAENGVSVFSPYFPDWKEIHLGDILKKEFEIPVFLDHDPNCMALAERWLGVAKGIKNLLFIRLSMGGIGMSIVINGEIYRGANGNAGELGHVIVENNGPRCTCGNYGCLEVFASGRSLLQKVEKAVKMGRFVSLSGNSGKDSRDNITIDSIIETARKGDSHIRELFEEAGTYMGISLSNMINLFNPELIVIGGELSKCEKFFMQTIKDIVNQKAWKWSNRNIKASELGDSSAAIGAAMLFIQKIYSEGMLHLLR